MRRGLVSLVLLAVAWTLAWFAATDVLRARFEASLAQARAQGWEVAAGAPVRAGFPFAAAIDVPDAAIAGGSALPGAGRITAKLLVVSVAIAHPLTLAMAVPQGLLVERPGLPPVAVAADSLVGTAPLFGPPSLAIAAHGLALSVPDGTRMTVATARLVLQPHGPDLGFDLEAHAVALPPAGWALGPDVALVRARGEATGALGAPPANGVRGTLGWIEDWQRRGGRLTLGDAALDWGPLSVAGKGTLALDTALQPDAALAVHVEGYGSALADMVRAGLMARGPALAAQFALGLLAHGDKPGIDVSATLHDGQLTVGGVKLGRVPEIRWPDAP